MATTEEDLQSFAQFVHERVGNGEEVESRLPELFDLWMLQTPRDALRAENVAAVNASINDFMAGERGSPAGQHSQQLREEYGVDEQ